MSEPSTPVDFEAPPSHSRTRGRHQQLSQEAADYLRDAIIAAEIGSGEFVRPERVADELGMSPTPVREALMALAKEGFLVWQPRRGFQVAKVRISDIEDVFRVQAFIAGELAARAAANIADADLYRLHELQTALERASVAGDMEHVQDLNFQIHKTINNLAASPAWPGCCPPSWRTCHDGSTDPFLVGWPPRSKITEPSLMHCAAVTGRPRERR